MNQRPTCRIGIAVATWALGAVSWAVGESPRPQWVWPAGVERSGAASGVLERSFEVTGALQSARVRGGADFCGATLLVNGTRVAEIDPYADWFDLDATDWLRTGENRLRLELRGVAGPSAIALSVEVATAGGEFQTMVTDPQWADGAGVATQTFGEVESRLWGDGRRSLEIDSLDDYTQWKRALGTGAEADQASFQVAPGFVVERLLLANESQSSWVALAFDPQGRILLAREDRGILRVTLRGEQPPQVQQIEDTLQECRGLLTRGRKLFANANNSKGLYRLTDRAGDGWYDPPRRLREFPGGVGHGRNQLIEASENSVYSIHGDSVDLPSGAGTRDYTSPLREARRGERTAEGHVVRVDDEGRQVELVCSGLRNPFGLARNADGQLFTYDADAEFDMGAPWYRPTRVVHIAAGADYGWRGVTGQWPPYDPDQPEHAPPLIDIGKGSPTAIAFGAGTAFPEPYRSALFILDWAYGRVLAVHMAPRGASYWARPELFLRGRPLNVTGIAFGPDGAMYLTTGGRKTQSALYRVRAVDAPSTPPEATAQATARATFAESARAARREVARWHVPIGERAVQVAWERLGDPDPLIRHTARVALEHQPVDTWAPRALTETTPAVAVEALLALARTKSRLAEIAERLDAIETTGLAAARRLALIRCYDLCWANATAHSAALRQSAIARLRTLADEAAPLELTPPGSGRTVRRRALELLIRLEDPAAVAPLVEQVAAARSQEEELHALFTLRNIQFGWTPELRRVYFTGLRDADRYLGGDGMPGFLTKIREESRATLNDVEIAELKDVLDPAPEVVDVPARPVVRKWTLDDVLSEIGRSTHSPDLERGRQLFQEALCVRCHRLGREGRPVGPDLSGVGARFARRDILESVVHPSKVIAEKYRSLEIETQDGQRVVGRPLAEGDYRAEKVRIVVDPLKPTEIVELAKQEIARSRESPVSPMPEGLLDTLATEEVIDLLAFLESGGVRSFDPGPSRERGTP